MTIPEAENICHDFLIKNDVLQKKNSSCIQKQHSYS